MRLFLMASFALPLVASICQAAGTGVVTAVGSVSVLTNSSQISIPRGTADFGQNHPFTSVPPNTYAASGMILHGDNGYEDGDDNDAVSLASILPGVTSAGNAILPAYDFAVGLFPSPIGGGGQQTGDYAVYGLTATFTVPVTQFGLTLSMNGPLYITAWRGDGTLIGQVSWQPSRDARFVGLSSGTTPIKMVTVGNDNVFAGAAYNYEGPTAVFDTVIWGVPEPTPIAMLVFVVMSIGIGRSSRAN